MKTSEQYGKTSFNWHEFLNKGTWSREELADARKRSASWVTCAVGNQCATIPRDGEGKPFDMELKSLGFDFYDCLSRATGTRNPVGQMEEAKEILFDIEKRSSELINNQNENIH